MKIALSTDTSCTISKELAKKLSIFIFPLNVIVNGEEFLDGVSIDQETLCKDMRDGKVIKTSTPPPGDVITYFEKIFAEGYDKIVHFTISSKLSSMNTLFNDISRTSFDNKVIVIDSYAVCSLMLSHVLFAYEELKKGTEPETIKEMVEERKVNNFVSFIPENLNALKNGGRISPTIAAFANVIGLKPVLVLKDGELGKDAMTRNVKKNLSESIQEIKEKYPLSDYDYSIVQFDCNEKLLDYIVSSIKEVEPEYKLCVFPIAINVCAHAGPGTIGLIVSPKFNGHSLNEYCPELAK